MTSAVIAQPLNRLTTPERQSTVLQGQAAKVDNQEQV